MILAEASSQALDSDVDLSEGIILMTESEEEVFTIHMYVLFEQRLLSQLLWVPQACLGADTWQLQQFVVEIRINEYNITRIY